ncbi:MAG: carboxypeptidase regulatory-like domain-containing protein [Acidobacteria bacterium]|nr:MAG: carboxypeptidase regulatory-like domain-containing protein [Acidobacteriota bacterium]
MQRRRLAISIQLSAISLLLALPGFAQTRRAATPAPTAAQVLFSAAAGAPPVVQGRGQLLGYVVDAKGRPEADAVVEVRAAGVRTVPLRARTSAEGLFRVLQLVPGTYYVRVGKGQRVAARRKVRIAASERALLLFNLPSLLEAARFGPPPGVSPDTAFAWALRSATLWGPILRFNDPEALDSSMTRAPVEGFVALTGGAGDSAFAAAALATTFAVNSIALGSQRLSLSGIVGTDTGIAAADTQVKATLQSADPSNMQRLSVSVRQMNIAARSALPALRLFSLNYSNALDLSPHLRVQYGSMFNAATMTDTVTTFDPYVRVMEQVSPEAVVEFRAVSGVPPLHFSRDSVNMDDPMPRVSLDQGRARLERARHEEVRYTENLTPQDTVSAAVFADQFTRTAVNGAFALSGSVSTQEIDANPELLPDLASNMFLANGGDYSGWGYRFGLEHQLGGGWKAIVGYATGEVLAPNTTASAALRAVAADLAPARAHALTFKIAGTAPLTHTQLVCSYRALNRLAATSLDPYDDSFTQGPSYANIFLRQPLPAFLGAGGKLAALIEIHNLLAQGYIPVLAPDGQTLFLVQSARSLRGGLTISF